MLRPRPKYSHVFRSMIGAVMLTTAAFAETAALMGDPARANMLAALMDGRALTAKELAAAARVTAQTR